MMSAAYINQLAREAASRARRNKRQPHVFENLDQIERGARKIPNLGSYTPKGWERVDCVLVDKMGLENTGPALGLGSLKAWIAGFLTKPDNYGFALIEEGQFQVVVGAFKAPKARVASIK